MILYYLYVALSPILTIVLYIIGFFNSKIASNIYQYKKIQKNVSKKLKNNTKPILLFHAASSGEFEQLKPILRKIDRDKYFIIQSCTSPTLFNEKNVYSKYVDAACYQPFDMIPGASQSFFKTLNPDIYLITRHDLWPKHIYNAYKHGIRIFYINANIHKKSVWMNKLVLPLSKFLFMKVNYITAPSLDIKKNIHSIDQKLNAQIIIDTRFEQIENRYQKALKLPKLFVSKFSTTTNIIFGSIDRYDLDIIIPTLNTMFPNGNKDLIRNNTQLIIVPHETNRHMIDFLISKLNKHKFNFQLLDDINRDSINYDDIEGNILVVNKVGILAELYRYARLAYVGGGFSRGVHSVIEPAIYDCLIAFGPNIEILAEAKDLVQQKAACLIHNSNDMIKFFKLSNIKNKEFKSSRAFFLDKEQSSVQIIKLIYDVI